LERPTAHIVLHVFLSPQEENSATSHTHTHTHIQYYYIDFVFWHWDNAMTPNCIYCFTRGVTTRLHIQYY